MRHIRLPHLIGTAALLVAGLWLAARPTDVPFWVGGLVFGFASQRSRLCLSAAIRDPVLFGATAMTRGVLILLLTVGLGGSLTAAAHWPGTGTAGAGSLPVPPLQAALGGALFGAGMVLAGSCVGGSLWRLGEGQLGQVWTLVSVAAGVWMGRGILSVLSALLTPSAQTPVDPPGTAAAASLAGGLTPLGAVTLQILALGGPALALWWWETRQPVLGEEDPPLVPPPRYGWLRAPWAPWAGALVVGGAWTVHLWTTGLPWRLTAAFRGDLLALAFAQGLVLGGLLGALLGSEFRLRGAGLPRPGPRRAPLRRQLVKRILGGLLMGLGAQVGAGCTVGALLGGIGSLSLHGWLWVGGAAAGGGLAALGLRTNLNRTVQFK